MTDLDPARRRELAKAAFETPTMPTGIRGDPYWLCNLHGEVNTDDMRRTAVQLRDDAALLEDMADRIDAGELLPEEAALEIARCSALGEYTVHDDYAVPISEEADSA